MSRLVRWCVPTLIAPTTADDRSITAEWQAALYWTIDYRMKRLRFALWRHELAVDRLAALLDQPR